VPVSRAGRRAGAASGGGLFTATIAGVTVGVRWLMVNRVLVRVCRPLTCGCLPAAGLQAWEEAVQAAAAAPRLARLRAVSVRPLLSAAARQAGRLRRHHKIAVA
jgi:hypothetical protein